MQQFQLQSKLKDFYTLSANTTLNKIIVGISLLGEGSVLETCTDRGTI